MFEIIVGSEQEASVYTNYMIIYRCVEENLIKEFGEILKEALRDIFNYFFGRLKELLQVFVTVEEGNLYYLISYSMIRSPNWTVPNIVFFVIKSKLYQIRPRASNDFHRKFLRFQLILSRNYKHYERCKIMTLLFLRL
jgi:hypothetical protein